MSDFKKETSLKDIDKIIEAKPTGTYSITDKDKINLFFTNYIKRTKEPGAIYFVEWKNLVAQDREYGEFHRKHLEETSKFSNKVFCAHPAIKYVSFFGETETFWFSGTGNETTANRLMIKAAVGKGRIDPLVLSKGSCGWHIYKYLDFRKRCVSINNYSIFESLIESAKRRFPNKDAYYIVKFKARFKVRIMPQTESYAGNVPDDVLFEIGERCQEDG
jgi:hypothetical protein